MEDKMWPKCFYGRRYYRVKDIARADYRKKMKAECEAIVKSIFDSIRNAILYEEMCERVRKLVREREKSRQALPKSGHQAVKDGCTKYKGIGKDGKRKRL